MVDDGVRLQLLHRPVEEAEADGDAGDARIARACNVVDRVAQEDRPPAASALDHGVDRRGMGLGDARSEEHTSELQSLMRISYAVFCLKKKKNQQEENM